MELILLYFGIVNVFTFFLSFFDKRAAIHHRRRVPEKTLFFYAAIGGAIGLYASMLIFRHKTKHNSFMIGVPVIIFIQLAVAWYFFMNQ